MEPEPKRGSYVDTSTGEPVDIYVQSRSRHPALRVEWVKTMQPAMDRMLSDDLPDGDFRVFVALLRSMEWNQDLVINVSEFALKIGRSRESVSRSLSRLVTHGYLIRGPRVGRSSSYRMAPDVAFKGDDAAHVALHRRMETRGMSVIEGGADASNTTKE